MVRASAGSRSTHPGRGKVVAVSAPPSAWVRPVFKATISDALSPLPSVFSAIDHGVSPARTV